MEEPTQKKIQSPYSQTKAAMAGQVFAAAQKLWAQRRWTEPYDGAGLSHSRRIPLNFASVIRNTTSLPNFKYRQKWLSSVSFSTILDRSRRNKISLQLCPQSALRCPHTHTQWRGHWENTKSVVIEQRSHTQQLSWTQQGMCYVQQLGKS